MNSASQAEVKTAFSERKPFDLVPKNSMGRILFWGALPIVFLLLTIGISFLHASYFSLYLPFLCLAGMGVCLRWKTAGLAGCYGVLTLLLLIFFKYIPTEHRLWHMGVIFVFAVDYFILLLSVEEVEGLVDELVRTHREKVIEIHQTQLHIQKLSKEWEDLRTTLEMEVHTLKSEAEQRQIEKQQESKCIAYIQSEIELLTSQKAHFVAEAKKARALLEQEGHRCEEVANEVEYKRLEGIYRQLHSQFEKKSQVLSQTRKELFQAQEKLLAMQNDTYLASFLPNQECHFYENALQHTGEMVSQLEEEVADLEEIISTMQSVE